jgi:biotin carboxyl carrier protein
MTVIVLDGVRREVTVERSAEGLVVIVDGRRHAITEVSATAGTVAFLVDRASHVAHVSTGPAGTKLSIGGRNYTLERREIDADRPSGAARGSGRLEAPMPGSIVAVRVSAGDRVRAGQPVVVLESMKMHNEITAPSDGVVRHVCCKVGDQVGYGHVLVEIGAE